VCALFDRELANSSLATICSEYCHWFMLIRVAAVVLLLFLCCFHISISGQWLLLPNTISVSTIWLCSELCWGFGLAQNIGMFSTLFAAVFYAFTDASIFVLFQIFASGLISLIELSAASFIYFDRIWFLIVFQCFQCMFCVDLMNSYGHLILNYKCLCFPWCVCLITIC